MKKILSVFVLVFSIFHFPFSVKSQVRPVYDYGAIGLGQLLKKLNTTKSVMMIGAHPDDEDSALLAYLARGENARTAYLSLTRGDGGQNIIGSELFESLGVIRTEELLQARRLDGAEQFFGRAFDYGFSKTLAEAKSKWDEKTVLCDTVKAIRAFRPLVVISRFSGTPADGHGQHQYAGYISPLAVKAAADETQCKDTGQAWQVQKFYVGQSFRSTVEPTLKINTGVYNSLLGRSYAEIALEGRSLHRTQEQGIVELKGDRFSGLNLVESKVPKIEKETSLFDGINTTISGALKPSDKGSEGDTLNSLQDFENGLSNKTKLVDLTKPESLVKDLLTDYQYISGFYKKIKDNYDSQSIEFLKIKQNEFTNAIRLASGLQLDALTSQETVVPSENFQTTVKIYFPDRSNFKIKDIKLNAPKDWEISKTEPPKEQNQNFFGREIPDESAFFNVKVAENTKSTQPYWLEKARAGSLFDWERDGNQNLPFQKPLITAEITAELDGIEVVFSQPVEYRFADDIRGEIRRELNVVPAVSISLDQNLIIVSQSNKPQTKKVVMSVTNNSQNPVSGEASLNIGLIDGWKAAPDSQNFSLKKSGEKAAISFEFTIPANAKSGSYEILPTAKVSGKIYKDEMRTLAYPHIQTHRFYVPAKAKTNVLDLKTAPVKIGYIAGSGDRVFDAIRQMNFDVRMLSENDLTNDDLSKFDTIVVGIRASQVRPDFIANHQRLLDYVKNGGTLFVQYQLPVYQNLLPFPAQMNSRVTDENAKVTILDSTNPVFNFPNKITDKDFENWVQERNLYAFSNFDANYKPLLESHDENEAENKGGLVVADIGKGKYIYCSYAFFRQLPAGVPGAYRLLANLLSLPKSENKKL